MQRCARGRLEEIEALDLCGYVLKKDSPSCGMSPLPRRREAPAPRARTGFVPVPGTAGGQGEGDPAGRDAARLRRALHEGDGEEGDSRSAGQRPHAHGGVLQGAPLARREGRDPGNDRLLPGRHVAARRGAHAPASPRAQARRRLSRGADLSLAASKGAHAPQSRLARAGGRARAPTIHLAAAGESVHPAAPGPPHPTATRRAPSGLLSPGPTTGGLPCWMHGS